MTRQPDHDQPPRRVVLEAVSRRDAAQRLSLALTLLARAGEDGHSDSGAACAPPPRHDPPTRPDGQQEGAA
jgi:hypothetical protein